MTAIRKYHIKNVKSSFNYGVMCSCFPFTDHTFKSNAVETLIFLYGEIIIFRGEVKFVNFMVKLNHQLMCEQTKIKMTSRRRMKSFSDIIVWNRKTTSVYAHYTVFEVQLWVSSLQDTYIHSTSTLASQDTSCSLAYTLHAKWYCSEH